MIIALIPAYNSVHTIAEVVLKTRMYVDKVFVYDDGSIDETKLVAEGCGAHVVRESAKNRGKGHALKRLFKIATEYNPRPKVIVTLDADMQHDPRHIPELIQPIMKDTADVVIGIREGMKKYRYLGGKTLDYFYRTLGRHKQGIRDTQSGFRAYSSKVLDKIEITSEGFAVDSEILECVGDFRIKTVQIDSRYDKYSHTKNFIFHFWEVFNFLFLRRPLLNMGILGFCVFFIGVAGLIRVVGIWDIHQEIAFGTFMISNTVMLLGALIFFVGVILHVIKREIQK